MVIVRSGIETETPQLVVGDTVTWLSVSRSLRPSTSGSGPASVISLSVVRSSGCQQAGRAGRFLARGRAWPRGGRAAPGGLGGRGPAGLGPGPVGGRRAWGLRADGVAVGAFPGHRRGPASSGPLRDVRQRATGRREGLCDQGISRVCISGYLSVSNFVITYRQSLYLTSCQINEVCKYVINRVTDIWTAVARN